MDPVYVAISVVVWLVCAIVCMVVAEGKGRSSGGWAVLGFLFGPFAVLAVAVASPIYSEQSAADVTPAAITPPPSPLPPILSVADELTKLADLRDRGALTDEEYQARKAKILTT